MNLEAVPGAVFQLHYDDKPNHPEGLSITWQADQALLTVKRNGIGHQIIGKEEPYLDSRLLDIWSDRVFIALTNLLYEVVDWLNALITSIPSTYSTITLFT